MKGRIAIESFEHELHASKFKHKQSEETIEQVRRCNRVSSEPVGTWFLALR